MEMVGFSEDLTHEFKSDRNCLPDGEIIDAVVAFANTDGGELYLGVEDSGEISGLHKKHMDSTQLAALVANKTVPPVSVRVEFLNLSEPVLKISVPKRTSVVASSNGKIQRRRLKADGTPENVPMYPYEIATRLSSLSLLDYSAQAVPDADFRCLDPVERERLRNIIRSYRGETSLLELGDEELDKALQLVTTQDGKLIPTFCGLLLIGSKEAIQRHMPTAEASIQVFSGTDIKVNESFHLPMLAAFDRITEYFSAWNSSEELESGMFRTTVPDYDPRAFREALVNAFCHRVYAMLGRAERTGRGIDRIFEGSLLNGRMLPDYSQSTSTNVRLFIPKGPTDKAFIRLVSEAHQRLGRSLPIYSLLVMNTLKRLNKATIHEIAEEVKTDETKIRVVVEDLVSSGLAEAGGSGRGRYYMLGAEYYKADNRIAAYVRRKDIDPIRYEEIVMQLARKKGFVRRADVVDLLRVTPSQAFRVLQKLSAKGMLHLKGHGAGAKYFVTE